MLAAKQSLVGKCAAALALLGHLIAIFPPRAPPGPLARCRQVPVEPSCLQVASPPPYVSLRHPSHCNHTTKSERENENAFFGKIFIDSTFLCACRATCAGEGEECVLWEGVMCCVWGGAPFSRQSSDALSLRDTHKTRPKQQNGTKPACSQSVEPRKVPSNLEMLEKYIFVLIFNAVWAEEGG